MFTRSAMTFMLALLVGCTADAPPASANGGSASEPILSTDQVPSALTLSAIQQGGKQLFETVCWTCHGTAGRGDGPVVTARAVSAPPSFQIGDYPGMSAADLKARFRAALVGVDESHPHMQYVMSVLQPESFMEALTYLPALVYPSEIPGSAIAGRVIYEPRCAVCHGETGRGDGFAAGSLIAATPADFTQNELIANRDWAGLFSRIREGGQGRHTSMPPWGMLFTEAEMWDLVAYIAALQEGVFPTLAAETSH
jgi:mono/diheme cytochrome c family protein